MQGKNDSELLIGDLLIKKVGQALFYDD